MASNITLRRKALFRTPTPTVGPSERNTDAVQAVTNRIAHEQEIATSLKYVERSLHERRLKKLRSKLDSLAEDDWKYPTIESLIGLK